jgi:hypothetical protein
MLQHNANVSVLPASRASNHAHFAHAAVAGMHALCCGLPAAAMLAAAASNAASGTVAVATELSAFHLAAHAYELWILAASTALVVIGGALEISARRNGARRGIPWLFALSAGCFLFNAAIIALHRGL